MWKGRKHGIDADSWRSGVHMNWRAAIVAALMLVVSAPCMANPGIADMLNIAWESFWQQSGYARGVYKWNQPLRVVLSGDAAARHREFALRQLHAVADIAGLQIIEATAGDTTANVEIEFVGSRDSLQAIQPCATDLSARDGLIRRVKVRANEVNVWRCMLHEAMHVMGIPGHPRGHTILTYFARDGSLTEMDRLLLRTIYSDEMAPGTSPLAGLQIMTRHIVGAVPAGPQRVEAENVADAFLQKTIAQMEHFANGSGEPPAILLRSSKTTAAGIAKGRINLQYYLGLAYSRGDIVAVDEKKAAQWLTRAAGAAHADGQNLLGEAYSNGTGVDVDVVEAYKWYYLGAHHGCAQARKSLTLAESRLAAEQIAAGRARAADWLEMNPQ